VINRHDDIEVIEKLNLFLIAADKRNQ